MTQLYPDTIWDLSPAEWQDIVAQQGKSALLEQMLFTEAYSQDSAKVLCQVVKQLDEVQHLMLLATLVGFLESQARTSGQPG